jgi:hypothetical protein
MKLAYKNIIQFVIIDLSKPENFLMKSSSKNRNHNMSRSFMIILVACAFLTSSTTQAAIIAFTNFDGHGLATNNIANDTATNLNWTLNGVADPGSLTAIDIDNAGVDFGLFNSNSTVQNSFSPNLNVRNEGPWSTTLTLAALAGSAVELMDITFDQINLNNVGGLNPGLPVDFMVSVTGSGSGLLDTVQILDSNGLSGSLSFLFTSPIQLIFGQTYDITIRASADSSSGNNVSIDNLSINGSVSTPPPSPIPEPFGISVFGFILVSICYASRKKALFY